MFYASVMKPVQQERENIAELDQILLVRDVILTTDGKLSAGSLSIAVSLKIPHHLGAGGD